MKTPAPGVVAVRAAFQAAWRVMISTFLLVTVPAVGIAIALWPLGDGTTSARIIALAAGFPVSFSAHELGHAVTYRIMACREGIPPEQFGIGNWSGGRIVRWPLSVAGDASVAIAGPLAGLACALPLLWPGGSFVIVFPFVLLYCIHLVSLRRASDDGIQARAFWRGDRRCSSSIS